MDYRQREAKANWESFTKSKITDAEWMAMQDAKRDAKRAIVNRQAAKIEMPVAKIERATCHYCGQPATGTGPFGESVCRECGGR